MYLLSVKFTNIFYRIYAFIFCLCLTLFFNDCLYPISLHAKCSSWYPVLIKHVDVVDIVNLYEKESILKQTKAVSFFFQSSALICK